MYLLPNLSISLNNTLLTNRHIQHNKDFYGTGSDRKLKAYINHLLKMTEKSSGLIHCYMLDKSICRFRDGVSGLFCGYYSIFDGKILSALFAYDPFRGFQVIMG